MTKPDGQFVLSFELLQLIEWLIEHQPDELKRLIQKSLAQGLSSNILQAEEILETYTAEDMQNTVIDFFSLTEVLLLESINEQNANYQHTQFHNTITQIDQSSCDSETVSSSVEKASAQIEKNSKQNAQAILFKELLKNWNPDKEAEKN